MTDLLLVFLLGPDWIGLGWAGLGWARLNWREGLTGDHKPPKIALVRLAPLCKFSSLFFFIV